MAPLKNIDDRFLESKIQTASLGRILSDLKVRFPEIEKDLIKQIEKLGIKMVRRSEESDFARILNNTLNLELDDLKMLPSAGFEREVTVNVAFDQWFKEGNDFVQLVSYCFDSENQQTGFEIISEEDSPYYERRDEPYYTEELKLKVYRRVTHFCKFKGEPTVLKFENDGTYSKVNARGKYAFEFVEELNKRWIDWFVKKHGGKVLDDDNNVIEVQGQSFADLIYPESLKTQIEEIRTSFHNWMKEDFQIKRWGVMIAGTKGSGKSTLARALITERNPNCTAFYLHSKSLNSHWDVRRIFYYAKLLQPTLLIIDDAEKITSVTEGTSAYNEYAERCDRTLGEILMELDSGLEESKVFLVLITSNPKIMHPAVAKRPGRISNVVVLKGYENCIPELMQLYAKTYGFETDPIKDIRKFLSLKRFFKAHKFISAVTPDIVKNSLQSMLILSNNEQGSVKISTDKLFEKFKETYEKFNDPSLDQNFLKDKDKDPAF